jgi:hypothetical protein
VSRTHSLSVVSSADIRPAPCRHSVSSSRRTRCAAVSVHWPLAPANIRVDAVGAGVHHALALGPTGDVRARGHLRAPRAGCAAAGRGRRDGADREVGWVQRMCVSQEWIEYGARCSTHLASLFMRVEAQVAAQVSCGARCRSHPGPSHVCLKKTPRDDSKKKKDDSTRSRAERRLHLSPRRERTAIATSCSDRRKTELNESPDVRGAGTSRR